MRENYKMMALTAILAAGVVLAGCGATNSAASSTVASATSTASSEAEKTEVQLNYSMCKAFVNRFGQNLRDPDAVHMGYFTVLNRHGRISRIPSINIFFVAHGIADRPVSLCNHRVGFKIRRAIR